MIDQRFRTDVLIDRINKFWQVPQNRFDFTTYKEDLAMTALGIVIKPFIILMCIVVMIADYFATPFGIVYKYLREIYLTLTNSNASPIRIMSGLMTAHHNIIFNVIKTIIGIPFKLLPYGLAILYYLPVVPDLLHMIKKMLLQ